MDAIYQKIVNGDYPDVEEFCELWGKDIPLLNELKYTAQDEHWHAEGDVHIHTDMVLDEIYDICEEVHFSDERKVTLVLAALFHDICKPLCTIEKEINGEVRLTCPRHEEKGRHYLATRLMAFDLPYEIIWNVMALVGNHQYPRHLVVDNAGIEVYKRLSRRVDLELLY